jgi:hypothetical protein
VFSGLFFRLVGIATGTDNVALAMKTIISIVCLALLVAFSTSTDAAFPPKGKKGAPKKKEYTPPPTPTPPPAPSVDISKFLSTNLDKILGPVEQKVPLPRAELAEMRTSFSARFSKASLAERNQFQLAISLCDALAQAMNEREKAALNPAMSNWTARSAQLRQGINDLATREKAAEGAGASPMH